MEIKGELKEMNIQNRTRYYFDDIIRDRAICSVDALLDEKIYENISVCEI